MRKLFLLASVFLMALFACDRKIEDLDPLNNTSINKVISDKIELADTNNINYQTINTYANARFGKTKGNTVKIDAVKLDNDTLAYIVNYGEGWELLAADDRYTPVLAKGEGAYDLDRLNPGQKIWLETELFNIKAVREGALVISTDEIKRNRNFWKKLRGPLSKTKADGDPIEDNQYWELVEIIDYDYEIESTGHLIESKWGQVWPWNTFIPYIEGNSGDRCKAGCVGVAGAQLLKFLHSDISKPATFYTSGTVIGDKDNWTFNFSNPSASAWNNMALNAFDSPSRTDQSALLIAWVANQVETEFDENTSTTNNTWNMLKNLFSDLNITYLVSDYDNMMNHISYYLMNKQQPCIIGASRNKIGLGDLIIDYRNSHVWLIDGYRKEIIYKKYIYQWTSQTDNHLYEYGEIREEIETEEEGYLLMNWGASGQHDSSLYASGPSATWQITVEGEEYHYKYNRKIIYDFN